MKQNTRTPKQRLLLAAGFLLSFFILQQSCTKIDTDKPHLNGSVEKFFTVPIGTEPQILRIVDELKTQNAKTGFIAKLATKEGYAVWNKVIISAKQVTNRKANGSSLSEEPDTLIYIPLVLENSQYVNSVIVARLNGDVTLKLYRGSQYQNFGYGQTNGESAQSVATTLAVLDNKVFGTKDFNVNDKRLFADTTSLKVRPGTEKNTLHLNVHVEGSSSTTSRPGDVWVTICTEHSGWIPASGLAGVFWTWGNWTTCETTLYSYLIDDTGGLDPIDPPSGTPTDPGGSGGGTPTNYPGNTPCTLIYNGELPPLCGPVIPQGPLTGWDGQNSNQSIIDSLTGYPCAQSVLAAMPNVNAQVKALLWDVFGVNDDVDIIYKTYQFPANDNTDGEMESFGSTYYKIRISKAMLNTASKDYILAVLIHEAVHAYIMRMRPSSFNGNGGNGMDSAHFCSTFSDIHAKFGA